MKTNETINLLREYESRNVLFTEPDGSWPIVWERANGVHVWDAEGKKYLDLTAAFGVAAAGHANPAVVRAGQKQMAKLLHAMGDVHPHALKAQLARQLGFQRVRMHVAHRVQQFSHLRLSGFDDVGIRVAGGGDAERGGEIQILFPVRIPDIHALRALPDNRPRAVGVNEGDVARFMIAQ